MQNFYPFLAPLYNKSSLVLTQTFNTNFSAIVLKLFSSVLSVPCRVNNEFLFIVSEIKIGVKYIKDGEHMVNFPADMSLLEDIKVTLCDTICFCIEKTFSNENVLPFYQYVLSHLIYFYLALNHIIFLIYIN